MARPSDAPISPRARELDEALNKIVASSYQVGEAIRSWKETSQSLQQIAPSTDQVGRELNEIRAKLTQVHSQHTEHLDGLKASRNNETMRASQTRISSQIKKFVEEEAEKQVNSHFDRQFKRVLPVTVEDQNKNVEQRIEHVDAALKNSLARTKNSTLTAQNGLYSLIESIAKPNSNEPSKLFPSTLQSLFYYPEEQLRDLCKDYELQIDENYAVNMNRFLNHIGIKNLNYKASPSPLPKEKKGDKGKNSS